MHLYKTLKGNVLQKEGQFYKIGVTWDKLINREDLFAYLQESLKEEWKLDATTANQWLTDFLLPPIGSQEVWAAGVTYLRSRDARMEESEDSGAADCYQRVYEAERPELFFKSLPHRVAGPGGIVHIRKDSTWDVPEPELTLFISTGGNIQAYTIGNDMSSRSIEGENPLYLPQAKMYERSAALGPCLWILDKPISPDTKIQMEIIRDGVKLFDDATSLNRMKRSLTELAGWLFKEMDFDSGAFLMTGTCVVPPNDFTLKEGDIVNIYIEGIGTLTNTIGIKISKK
ncbi:fumarylacetoacetate hydrolase family protein [Flavihumibacter profundi]|uniref:fumarylacetoacetate hydrolase family protein n=1 Tax=Flavihumibacter profundi TaxID=2716883 RepID=UPI001CC3D147|nr:fumarylacetoacetate hydrolase family protein [Flavihumibacter profundi]MBZ5859525.1 fumarylacetoacetate hydrolase family protein [Flavihumibacter profundi]